MIMTLAIAVGVCDLQAWTISWQLC